jgi:hypothetical protein
MQIIRVFWSVLFLSMLTYFYLNDQNKLIQKKFELEPLISQVQKLKEQNRQLFYEIQVFESPSNLMVLAKNDPYRHLIFPKANLVAKLENAQSDDFFVANEH